MKKKERKNGIERYFKKKKKTKKGMVKKQNEEMTTQKWNKREMKRKD